MPRHSAPQQPAWLRPRLVVTLAVATAGLATAVWLPTRNDSADASERDRFGGDRDRSRTSSLEQFSDDFAGPDGAPADPGKWILDTSRTDNGLEFRGNTRNARLDGEGNLLVTARRSDRSGLTSARLISRAAFRREAGQVEARVRVPGGDGVRPAFELLGAGRPGSGTINLLAEPVTDGDFHTYAVSWTPDSVTLSVDGAAVRRTPVPGDETGQPFRIALSLDVTDVGAAELPARMAVDFVGVDEADRAEPPSTPPTVPPTAPSTTPPTTPPTQEPTTPPADEPTTAPTTPPTQEPTTPPAPAAEPWKPFTDYAAGQVVTFQGDRYEVKEAHTSLPGWEPTALPNLFKKL